MDALPLRKRKADDDPDAQSAPPQPSPAPPRLTLQTSAWLDPSSSACSPDPSPSGSSPTGPPYPSSHHHHPPSPARAKRPRIDPSPSASVSAPSICSSPTSPTSPVASAGPSPTLCVAPCPPPTPIVSSPSRAYFHKRAPNRRADELLSDLQTLHGRRWRWMTVHTGETRLVATFRPVSQWTRPSDILLSQSAPSSPVAGPRQTTSVVIPIDPCSSHIPPRFPTINKDTLRELDMDSIMRNPQLRHDFLFDSGLQFRASTSRRKREQAEAYWRAVDLELNTGCTCVTFDIDGRPQACYCICKRIPAPPSDPVIACLPQRRRLTLRMPSRLRPLLQELLAVLLSIIKPPRHSTAPSAPQQRTQQTHAERQKQNAEHARTLTEILDADLILQEVAHDSFNPAGTFTVISEILKAHCAPMRDTAIDAMVALAHRCSRGGEGSKSDAIRAIRACFEILELMKLDIANHQMQTLRPHIVHNAPKFELSVFRERHRHSVVPFALTRQWLGHSHAGLSAAHYSPPYPVRPLAFDVLSFRTRTILSTLHGLVDLVFDPPASAVEYPETLYLDHGRLTQLTKDAADLTALYALMMLFRQLLHAGTGSTALRDTTHDDAHLARAKAEVRELWPHGLGRCFVPTASDPEPHPAGLREVVLQVAARAAEARRGRPPAPGPATAPPSSLVALAERWADTHLRLASPLGTLFRTRMRAAVLDVLVHTVVVCGTDAPAPASALAALAEGSGLAPLAGEVRALTERLAKLAVLHLNVYQTVYETERLCES